MKILFVQLPLLDHSHSYIAGNVEYAPASMAGYIKRAFGNSVDIEYLPFILSNFASNEIIARYILAINPDIVSFTCYLWNVERNMRIARMIKNRRHGVIILAGGPEISENSWALSKYHETVDFFIQGEGEWFFSRYMEGDFSRYARPVNRNMTITQPADQLLPPSEIVEPFTHRMLNSMSDGSIFLELTRGCPYKCNYCYYSKNAQKVREMPFDLLLKAIGMADRHDLNEIYILSPTFNRTKDFLEKLRVLASLHHSVRLHTEMRSDGIDKPTAKLLYQAGFRSLEIGLQTMSSVSLATIGRKTNVDAELRGMDALQAAGIELKIGVIPGLPGDTPDEFIATVDRLCELGFSESIEYYPLMVLPGTGIRDRAETEGVDFQLAPPYYLLNGWNFDLPTLRAIAGYCEDKTGLTHSYRALPDLSSDPNGALCKGIRFDGDVPERWEVAQFAGRIETNVFSFIITVKENRNLAACLKLLLRGLPGEDQLYNIMIHTNTLVDDRVIRNLIEENESDSLFARVRIFEDESAGFTIVIYQVFDEMSAYQKALHRYDFIIPVFKITRGNYGSFLQMNGDEIENIILGDGAFYLVSEHLSDHYSDRVENISFENENEQKEFYRRTDREFVALPSFKIMDLD